MKAANAWFPQPTLGIYIPVPARRNNKLWYIVTDPTGQTTGRSLQAIYQIKWVLNSTLKVWMRKQLSLNRKLPTNWKASGQDLKKSLEVGSWSPSGQLGSLVPLSLPSGDSSGAGLQCSGQKSPQPAPQGTGLQLQWSRISGGSGLSLRPPVSWSKMLLVHGCTVPPGARGRAPWSGIQHHPLHCSTSQRQNHGREMHGLMHPAA